MASRYPPFRPRLEAEAVRLGDRPNALARTLITRRWRMIGVVMAAIDNPFHAQLLQCLDGTLQSRGFAMLLRGANHPEMTDALIHYILSYQVDGVIVASGAEEPARPGRRCGRARRLA